MNDYRLQLGKVAGVWFFACLFGLAALYPGYSHLTKAVSELGAFGAPHAVIWNVLGFFSTGGMIVLFGLGLQHLLRKRNVKSTGGISVVALGITFAATAIPADFELRLQSPWTVAHAVFVLLGPVAFIWSAAVWPRALARLGAPRSHVRMCAAAGLLLLPAFASNALLSQTPGVGQRLGFAVIFLWCWVLSNAASRVDAAADVA
ncbi:DUF998 domain-containing protein [Pirellulales bacterium]|nr:DUF998 domain-containing protein [Pirellulales bacterium]